ncbi:MAG TPA: PKD domain-containing protein, partial [Thermoanaerobaculia bacterium]
MSSVCATFTAGLAALRWLLLVLAIVSPVVAAGQGAVLTNGANHTGVIPVGGLDTWTFQATQNDSITIAIGERPSSGADPKFLPRIRLRGPDGESLGDSDGTTAAEIDERAPSSGTYTVLVSTADCCTTQTGPGPYFLTLVKTPGSYVVSSGDQGGAMTNGANHVGAIAVGDVDAWTFHANAGESITVGIGEVAGSGSDPKFLPRIRLRGPDGEPLGDSDGSDAAEIDERAPRAGTYTVIVSTASCCTTQVGTGSYVVTLAKTPGPYTLSSGDQGGPLTNGANHAGVISIGDLDAWTLQANAGDSIAVSIGETAGSDADPKFLPRIRLRGPDGEAVADSDGSDDAAFDELAPTSGIYTVLVSTAACCTTQVASAGYVLTVARTPGTYTVSPGDQGGTMTNGTAYTGEIPVGDMDVWTFSAISQDNVVLRIGEVVGSGPDPRFLPRIRLRGPDGERLGDADGLDDAEIARRVPSSGTYTVLVSTASCCTTQTGTASYRLTVAGLTAPVPPPRVNAFAASPAAITAGQSSTLSWSTANATAVAISSIAGTQPPAGSVVVSPAATTAYTLTATGPGGTATATATVVVNAALPPSITSFIASPTSINAGQSSTLTWTTGNATTVSISGISGTLPVNGSVTVSPSVTTTYTLTATGAGGTANATATVVVNTVSLPSIASFTASPASINAGQSSTLTWTTANATTVSISGISGTHPVNGSTSVTPSVTTTYTLTATGAGGTANATTTVTVGSAGVLEQLRFSFGSPGRRRAVRTHAAGDDVILLARRNPDDRFTAPVLGAVDDEPFPQADVTGGVLTLSGAPGGRTLDEWLPAGGTARISIANGDGEQFVVILRRTASDLAVVSPEIAAIGGSAFTPASTLTISGAHFSSRADENTVVLKTPDGRSFPVVPVEATATTLSILVPVIPTAAGTALYEGPLSLHVETAPKTDSNALSFTLLPLPQLQRAPGTETRELLALIDELSGTIQDGASAQLAAAGMPADQLQALRQIPHDVANVLSGQLAGALDGQPQQLLVDYDGAQHTITLDRDAVILFERLLQASGAVDQLRQTAMRARAVLDSECDATNWERFILAAETAYEAADLMGKVMTILEPFAWLFERLALLPGGQAFAGPAALLAIADLATTMSQVMLSAMPIVLDHLSLSRDPLTLAEATSTSVAVHGHFSPILLSTGAEMTLADLIDDAVEAYIKKKKLRLFKGFIAQIIKSAITYLISPIIERLGGNAWQFPLLKPREVPLSSATTLVTAPGSGGKIILGPLCGGTMTIQARAGASGTIGYSVYAHRFSRTANAYSARMSGIIKVTSAPATQPIAAMDLQAGGASVQERQTLTAEVPVGGTASVSLSAARSRSSTGALQYTWTIDGQPASTQRDFITALPVGVYTVHLTVRDSNGSATAIATVNVVNRFQTLTAGFTMTRGSEQAHEGETLVLLGDAAGVQIVLSGARSFDPQGNPLAYEWRVDGGTAGTGRDLTRTFAPGSFAIRLTVTSTAGVQASATGTVTVTQRAAAQPVITSVTPSAVPAGDTTLTIYGTNLNAAVSASVTGPSCPGSCTFASTQFQDRTATSFRLNMHLPQSGRHNLTVTNGTATSNSASITVVQETPDTMTGSLTPASPSCTIASGSSSCNVTLTWTTTNPVDVSRVTSNSPSPNTLIDTGNSGSKSVEVPYGGRSFFLYNNGVELDRSNATASCASGTSWNGSRCQSAMSGSLTPASPSCTIASGGSSCNVTLSWTTTNPVDVSRVTSNYPTANTLIDTGNSGSKSVEVPYGGRSFFLYNNGVELDRSDASANCASGTSWNGSRCQSAMSGSLTPAAPSCTIASGGSSCNVTLSWTTTNPVDVSRVTSNYPTANTLIDTGNSGSKSVEVPYGGRSFFLYNNGVELDRSNATASCASGTSWNGSRCQGAMTGSLTPASPSCTIASGGSSCNVTLSWTTTNPVDVSRVTSNYPTANTLIDTGNSGSKSVEVPYGGRSFFLYNNGVELDRSDASASCASGTSWNGSRCQGAMTGSLTPAAPSCTIASGGSSCNVTLSWTTTNPVDVSRVTSNYPAANTLIDTGNSGSKSVEVP